MSDEPRGITDEMMLSDLTVGEFKQLIAQLLSLAPTEVMLDDKDVSQEPKTRKSLDQFMSDLGDK